MLQSENVGKLYEDKFFLIQYPSLQILKESCTVLKNKMFFPTMNIIQLGKELKTLFYL